MEITENNLNQAIAALRKCADDVANYLENSMHKMTIDWPSEEQIASKLTEIASENKVPYYDDEFDRYSYSESYEECYESAREAIEWIKSIVVKF